MKRLVKRYVLKAQADSEKDEVNEGRQANFCGFNTLTHRVLFRFSILSANQVFVHFYR